MIAKKIRRKLIWACLLIWTLGSLSCGSSRSDLENKNPITPQSKRVSIAYVRSLYIATPVQINEELYFEGRVVSNDSQGSFFQTIVVEDETGGIPIRVALDNAYQRFEQFRRVMVRCNSLQVGSYGGAVELGVKSKQITNQTDPIPTSQVGSFIIPVKETEEQPEIAPTEISIGAMSPRYINVYVIFKQVQFIDEELGLSWSDKERDTDRHLIDIRGDTLVVRTSSHASFAPHTLPMGSGEIVGILGYFNREYQLVISLNSDVYLNHARFTPTPTSTSGRSPH